MNIKDHYSILGIPRSANRDDIQKAYRKKAQILHPDRNPNQNAVDKFHEIKESYEILYDEKKRKDYDFSWSQSLLSSPIQTATQMWSTYIQGVIQ